MMEEGWQEVTRRHLVAAVCGILCGLTLLITLFIARVLYRHPSRTSIGVCLGGMVSANLLTCVLDGGLCVARLLLPGSPWQQGDNADWLWSLGSGVKLTTQTLTALVFIIVATDRAVVMLYPRQYKGYFGRSKMIGVILMAWFASVICGCSKGAAIKYYQSRDLLAASGVPQKWQIAELVLFLFAPLIFVALMTFLVGRALCGLQRNFKLTPIDSRPAPMSCWKKLFSNITRERPDRPALTDVRGSRALIGPFLAQAFMWVVQGVWSIVMLYHDDVTFYVMSLLTHFLTPLVTSCVLIACSPTFQEKLPGRLRCTLSCCVSVRIHPEPHAEDQYDNFKSIYIRPYMPEPRPQAMASVTSPPFWAFPPYKKMSLSTPTHGKMLQLQVENNIDAGHRRASFTSIISILEIQENDVLSETLVQVQSPIPFCHRHSLCSEIVVSSPKRHLKQPRSISLGSTADFSPAVGRKTLCWSLSNVSDLNIPNVPSYDSGNNTESGDGAP